MSQEQLGEPAPAVAIPESSSTVDVRIIDTTSYGSVNTSLVFDPPFPGHETFKFPSYAFLITHLRLKKHVLFDLGITKDWDEFLPPASTQFIKQYMPFTAKQNVQEILDEDSGRLGVTTGDISSVIWSHHHFDHRGDITSFPPSTELVVGPGFQNAFAPYYPTDPASSINERELQGRNVRELADSDFTLRVGRFPAHDFFGDGSLYILNAPGHTVGHIGAMARLTSGSKPTFALLGGDCAHHPGIFRPSPYLPLPCRVPDPLPSGETFRQSLRDALKSPDKPFFKASTGVNVDQPTAEESVNSMQEFDAHEDVLVCVSHDASLLSCGIEFYPGKLNGWKELEKKGRVHRDRVTWGFCCDFDTTSMSKVSP